MVYVDVKHHVHLLTYLAIAYLALPVTEPVWPSGKELYWCKANDVGSNPRFRLSSLCNSCGLRAIVLVILTLTIQETLKRWLDLVAACPFFLMQK